MKANAVALSFGYLVIDQKQGRDGINELREIDLFEISIVPSPANPDTRILEMKSDDRGPATTGRGRSSFSADPCSALKTCGCRPTGRSQARGRSHARSETLTPTRSTSAT
jgi:hypothetical protein